MTTDGKLHEATSMAGLIDYQSGTVASRTIVKGKTGTVTVFAFDEGEELSEHTAPFDALVHVIDGEAEITIEGQPYAMKQGEMIVMPADRPHAVRAVRRDAPRGYLSAPFQWATSASAASAHPSNIHQCPRPSSVTVRAPRSAATEAHIAGVPV